MVLYFNYRRLSDRILFTVIQLADGKPAPGGSVFRIYPDRPVLQAVLRPQIASSVHALCCRSGTGRLHQYRHCQYCAAAIPESDSIRVLRNMGNLCCFLCFPAHFEAQTCSQVPGAVRTGIPDHHGNTPECSGSLQCVSWQLDVFFRQVHNPGAHCGH